MHHYNSMPQAGESGPFPCEQGCPINGDATPRGPPDLSLLKETLSERDVLERCYQGLMDTEADFTPMESAWVICRLAELMGWAPLEWETVGESR